MKESKQKTKYIAFGAIIAALYVVLTVIAAPISFGEVQLRLSEILTVLPYFTSAAIPGLFVGCLIANILGGAMIWDVIFGSLATLIGAIGSYFLRKNKYLVPIPPILANAIIVPFVLRYGYGVNLPISFMVGSVGLGEIISCGVLGLALLFVLEKYKGVIFDR